MISLALDHVELDVRRRRDQLEVELALEPLLHDVHVQQTEEPGPEPEAERLRGLGLVAERRVRELQPVERLAELRVVAALVREQARPHHRLRLPVAGERLGGGVLAGDRDRVADLGLVDVLQPGDEVADLAGTERIDRERLGRHHAGLLGLGLDRRRHQTDPRAARQLAVLHADVGDHPAVGVEHRVEDQGPQRRVRVAGGRRHLVDHGLQQLLDALAGLRRDPQDVVGIAVEEVGELLRALVGLGGGQVDLVEGGHDHEPGVARQVEVRERLGLEALRGVDQQDRALAGLERPRDLVGEVDVAGRVDQVQLVAVVREPDRLRLDRDPALPLQVHPVEVLRAHVAVRDGVGELQQAVGQRGLAVVDVRHDAEVPDVGGVHEASMLRVPGCDGAGHERDRLADTRW